MTKGPSIRTTAFIAQAVALEVVVRAIDAEAEEQKEEDYHVLQFSHEESHGDADPVG